MGSSGTVLVGADNYIEGLKKFAGLLVKGSARVAMSIGDERNAVLLVTAKGKLRPRRAASRVPTGSALPARRKWQDHSGTGHLLRNYGVETT